MNSLRLVIAVVLAAVLASCSGNDTGGPTTTTTTVAPLDHKLVVVVTTPQLKDFASVLGGNRISVTSLVENGLDPRTYVLSAADVTAVANADLIIQNGLGLEPWFDTFIKTAERKGALVNASTSVSTRRTSSGAVDPAIWMSPSNVRVMTANVRKALADADPANKSVFEANERAYSSQIDNVITYTQQALQTVGRVTIASIDEPIGYYCDEFGMLDVDVPTTSFDASRGPSQQQIDAIIAALTATKPRLVVLNAKYPSVVTETITAHTGVKAIGGLSGLRTETLGSGTADNQSYLAMLRHTTDVLSANLR